MANKTRQFYRDQTTHGRETMLKDKDERIKNMKKEMKRLDSQLDAVIKDTTLIIANQRVMAVHTERRIANLKRALSDLIEDIHAGNGEPEPHVWEEATRVLEDKR
jgi:hypothetical protein